MEEKKRPLPALKLGPAASTAVNIGAEAYKVIALNYNTLKSISQAETNLGGILMKMIEDIQKAEAKDQQNEQSVCEIVTKGLSWFLQLLKLRPEKAKELTDNCINHALEHNVEALRKELQEVLAEQKAFIIRGQITEEKFRLTLTIVSITSNLSHIFNGLEQVQLDNAEKEAGWKAKLRKVKGDLDDIKSKDFGTISDSEFCTTVRLLESCVENARVIYDSIAISKNQQSETRNSYYASCLSSTLSLGFTALRWYYLREYDLTAADKLILGVSAGAHLAAGGTSFYLGWEYGKEVERFGVLLKETLQLSEQMQYYQDLVNREKQNREKEEQ